MQLPESIGDNLRFLCLEVDSQINRLQGYLGAPEPEAARQLIDRSGYALNLKMRIHDGCLSHLACDQGGNSETSTLRSVEFVATGLERIAELCRDCVRQTQQMRDPGLLGEQDYQPMLKRVRRGVELIEPALLDNDTKLALKISQIEDKLGRDYERLTKRYITALRQQSHTEDLTRALFVGHSVEQMGDALQDISEAIISANLGQPMTIDRYQSLQASTAALDGNSNADELQIERIAETRSGSSISGISNADDSDHDYVAVFKNGTKRKLKEERQGVKRWHKKFPGLAPRILSYKKREHSATLLIEHLPGLTFEQILLRESPALLEETLRQLALTLNSVWDETRIDRIEPAHYMRQLEKRLQDVYQIHPEFQREDRRICGLEVPGFDRLVEKGRRHETAITPPFSVYIHGDFNLDNIIYSVDEKRINFIDLHRSRYLDYVQDVSVFMVSNYRLQILDAPLRRRIMKLALDFYILSRDFARRNGDHGFDLRLALGLARSFATSTRFILDKSLARSMFLRARYLLEQAIAVDPEKAKGYRVPVEEIFVG